VLTSIRVIVIPRGNTVKLQCFLCTGVFFSSVFIFFSSDTQLSGVTNLVNRRKKRNPICGLTFFSPQQHGGNGQRPASGSPILRSHAVRFGVTGAP
jgi:hypothetical protein